MIRCFRIKQLEPRSSPHARFLVTCKRKQIGFIERVRCHPGLPYFDTAPLMHWRLLDLEGKPLEWRVRPWPAEGRYNKHGCPQGCMGVIDIPLGYDNGYDKDEEYGAGIDKYFRNIAASTLVSVVASRRTT
jgi:hypothetical protein